MTDRAHPLLDLFPVEARSLDGRIQRVEDPQILDISLERMWSLFKIITICQKPLVMIIESHFVSSDSANFKISIIVSSIEISY